MMMMMVMKKIMMMGGGDGDGYDDDDDDGMDSLIVMPSLLTAPLRGPLVGWPRQQHQLRVPGLGVEGFRAKGDFEAYEVDE